LDIIGSGIAENVCDNHEGVEQFISQQKRTCQRMDDPNLFVLKNLMPTTLLVNENSSKALGKNIKVVL